jgi:ketosteroid isomerase-like protein
VLSYHEPPTAALPGWNVTAVYFRSGDTWKVVHTHRSYLHHRRPALVEVPVPVEFPSQVYDGVLDELMALETTAMVRWRKGDPWGFADLYDPTITYFDTGTPQRIDGLAAMRAEYASRAGKIFYDVNDFIAPQIQVCGDTVVLFYRFFSTTLRSDGSIADRTPWNCTEVYTRVDGQWKIIHNHWSFIRGEAMNT